MTNGSPTLIGFDWGSSSLRAYLFDEHGAVLAEQTRPWGVLSISGRDLGAAYHEVVSDWRSVSPALPAIAAGMIGSTEGWVLAPYCACPAGAPELADALVEIQTAADGIVRVIPGIALRGAAPDVMRGEETQVVGALALRPELARRATLVLPGTHAKWVDVRAGRVVGFSTYMTGEVFAVLSEHSILGKPARSARARNPDAAQVGWDAFDRGVALARENDAGGIAPLLFRARSLVLQDELRAEESLDFLSGLLVGDEVRSGLARADADIALVGDPALCERYRRALWAFGVETAIIADASPAGLWQIACRANLVAARLSHV